MMYKINITTFYNVKISDSWGYQFISNISHLKWNDDDKNLSFFTGENMFDECPARANESQYREEQCTLKPECIYKKINLTKE